MHLFWLLLFLALVLVPGIAVLKLQNAQNTQVDGSAQGRSQRSESKRIQKLKQHRKTFKESTPKTRVGSLFGQLQEKPHCAGVLQCHTEEVTCFAFHPKKRCLLSCSSDRSVRVWWDPMDKQARFSSVTLFTCAASEYKVKFPDSAEACCWSKDGQLILFVLSHTRAIRSYDVLKNKKLLSGSLDVVSTQKSSVKDIELDPLRRYFVTYDDNSSFVVWNMRGSVLTRVDTHQVRNNQMAISPDGRFIASAGFIGDVYLWEILFQKDSNEFIELRKVIDLKGHRAGVKGLAFSHDRKKVATVCKDRTIRIWNIDVKYKLEEDAKLLFSLEPWDTQVDLLQVAFSPDDNLLAVVGNDSVAFYLLETRKLITILRGCTGQVGIDIKKFSFSGDGTLLATIGQGQSFISLWNVPVMPSFSNV
ncbi:transducin family protein / WD-40 repeat family protein isoform 2 [Galdieria sulphuraria]|uniref:Transducin family protein / WD-40 repeat family protein isoform 1 n=1 Tax=Galdieria sulphuraria TaxID=130081 RepID=M2W0R7_GALSU|nr:transducin family protein / WD-40 repeat family protein isoform 1 [Galdieria sulphuraria]XP_005705726.1 transducin family protein / WD-40 repeat family protein isoform 2 [Galdieria sulphuraria]EME29205.1 transducin family protein / WD-40 repeat family protein isoform 1 [Galdieria sulphuraria]EME29206.1 transducin family protein / WD-40 repeat family protein isoform 2 [Galdieria sulphuraria]|eukprot:XP_005705725.1 transducin family protein / WD-40 repeat family protein isoform 1 [Galdieria sulphuraria]